MEKIGILGCGWLGFTLAKKLIEKSYCVNGTSRNEDKKNIFESEKIAHFKFQLGDEISTDFINDVSILIIAFPINKSFSVESLSSLIHSIEQHNPPNLSIIFTSSISVYLDEQGEINENTGKINPNSPNYIFEQELLAKFPERVAIIRLGGLIGEDRHPIYSLAGRTGIANENAPVNLVHRNDAIEMILEIIERKKFGHVYNCVYPDHPTKEKYYTKKAIENSLTPPKFEFSNKDNKLIQCQNAKILLNFNFSNPI